MAVLGEWDGGALPPRLGGIFSLGSFATTWPFEWINCDHNGVGPAMCRFEFGSGKSVVSLRGYIRTPDAWPTAALQFFGVRNVDDGPNFQAAMAFGGESNPGQLRIMSGGVLRATSPQRTLQPSRWYRFELRINFFTQQMIARVSHLHRDHALWTSSVLTTAPMSTGTLATLADVGAAQGSLLLNPIRITNVRITDTDAWIGRHSTDTFPWAPPLGDYSQVKFVSGGTLHSPLSVQIWEGDRTVPAVSMVYSGYVPEPEPPDEEVGTVLATQTFNSQSNGQPLSLSSPWSEDGAGGSVAFTASTAAAMHGALGARLASSSGYRRINYTATVTDQLRCYDFYVNVRTMSTNVWLFATDTNSCDIRLNSDGTVRIRDNLVAVDVSTETLSTNQWYRFSYRLSDTGQTLRVFEDDDDEPILELSGPLSSMAHAIARFGLSGASNGTTLDLDTLRIGDGWLPPAS